MVDTAWTFKQAGSGGNLEPDEFRFDAVSIDDGYPDFTVGTTVELTAIMSETDDGKRTYQELVEYNEGMYDGVVEYGTDYQQAPYYKEYDAQKEKFYSLLFELYPYYINEDESIDNLSGWWVVLVDIEDISRYAGVDNRMKLSLFVVAPRDEGSRELISDRYEVNNA